MANKALAAVLVEERKIELQEFDVPKVNSNSGLLRVEATGICGSDWSQYRGELQAWGVKFPIIPGHEVLGHIEEIGEEAAKRWRVNKEDRVIVEAKIPCGRCAECLAGSYINCDVHISYGLYLSTTVPPSLWGGYGQYMFLHPNSMVHKISPHVPAEQAVLFMAIGNGIRWASQVPGTQIGDTVVIHGPGQHGLGCVIGAKEAGASCIIVAGLTADAKRLALAKELGADFTIDVQKEDLIETVRAITNGRMVNVAIDVSEGATEPVTASVDLVRKRGTIVLAGLKHSKPVNGLISDRIIMKQLTIKGVYTHDFRAVEPAIHLIESGKYPFHKMCSHKFPLDQAEIALKTVGRQMSGEDPIHVTIAVE